MKTPEGPPAARLDDRIGRGAAPPPKQGAARRFRPRFLAPKQLGAALLVAALALTWLTVRARHDDAPVPAAAVPPGPVAVRAPVVDTAPLRRLVGADGRCTDVASSVPEIRCTVGDVRIDARAVGAARAPGVYATEASAQIAARRGPPACAHGHDDERSWSRPATPTVIAGRYRCRVERGVAAIWWTDEHGVVAHAVAADADRAALFEWWRAHVEE